MHLRHVHSAAEEAAHIDQSKSLPPEEFMLWRVSREANTLIRITKELVASSGGNCILGESVLAGQRS
ncbi:hypothetical protein SAMN05216411_10414 [Nitrosospira multiformis]|nr:hypothetical protein SAMN05216411_10414 [Nitrosospira multiformis]